MDTEDIRRKQDRDVDNPGPKAVCKIEDGTGEVRTSDPLQQTYLPPLCDSWTIFEREYRQWFWWSRILCHLKISRNLGIEVNDIIYNQKTEIEARINWFNKSRLSKSLITSRIWSCVLTFRYKFISAHIARISRLFKVWEKYPLPQVPWRSFWLTLLNISQIYPHRQLVYTKHLAWLSTDHVSDAGGMAMPMYIWTHPEGITDIILIEFQPKPLQKFCDPSTFMHDTRYIHDLYLIMNASMNLILRILSKIGTSSRTIEKRDTVF